METEIPVDDLSRRPYRPAGGKSPSRPRCRPQPAARNRPEAGARTPGILSFKECSRPKQVRRLSNDERSLKENILRLSLGFEGGPGRLNVVASGDRAARLKRSPEGRYRLLVLTAWDYPDIDWGNLTRPFRIAERRRGQVSLRLEN